MKPPGPAPGSAEEGASPARPRSLGVQALRAAAALGVVLYHAEEAELTEHVRRAYSWIGEHGQAGVDLFFAISGFILAGTTAQRAVGPRAAGRFVVHRFWRIFPLYWIFTLLALAVLLARRDLFHGRAGGLGPELLTSFLLLPHAEFPLLGPAWSLVHEWYFSLVFALTLLAPARSRPWLAAAWIGIVVLGHWAVGTDAGPWLRVGVHPLTVEFAAGALFYFAGGQPLAWNPFLPALASALAIGAAVATGTPPMDGWLRPALYGTAALGALWTLLALESQGRWVPPAFLTTLGDASYAIFLSHLFVVHATCRFLAPRIPAGTVWGGTALSITCLLLSCLVGLAVHRGLERPLGALGRRSRGPRTPPVTSLRRPDEFTGAV